MARPSAASELRLHDECGALLRRVVQPAICLAIRADGRRARGFPFTAQRSEVTTYYEGPDLQDTVFAAIRAAGADPETLDPDDLAGMDEFHALGRAGTIALARLANITPGSRVIDVGAGIGGPARALARHFGAHVTVAEPTEPFAALATHSLPRSAGSLHRADGSPCSNSSEM